jgi:hypothetical protein
LFFFKTWTSALVLKAPKSVLQSDSFSLCAGREIVNSIGKAARKILQKISGRGEAFLGNAYA